MKKYLLKLITDDIVKLKHFIKCHGELEQKWLEDPYQIKQLKIKKRKLNEAYLFKEIITNMKTFK